jgi:hypothetical protein
LKIPKIPPTIQIILKNNPNTKEKIVDFLLFASNENNLKSSLNGPTSNPDMLINMNRINPGNIKQRR